MPDPAVRKPLATFQPISALPEIGEFIDIAPGIIKRDISRIKKFLADRNPTLPLPVVAFTLQEAKDALDVLGTHARQLARWRKETISDSECAEVIRLQVAIPEIRPLIQRLIALSTELDKYARTGTPTPRTKWRH